MCGILGAVIGKSNQKSNQFKILFNIFSNQANRGVKGGGISINHDGNIERKRTNEPVFLFSYYYKDLWDSMKQNDKLIFHHRFPTTTPNKIRCNHPLSDEKNQIFISHNGMISNKKELYEQLKHKHNFESYHNNEVTDSELIVHVLQEELRNCQNTIIPAMQNLVKRIKGSLTMAFFIQGHKMIYLYKQYNPLYVYTDHNNNFYFSSEFDKESKQFSKVRCLSDGELVSLDEKGMRKLCKINTPKQIITTYFCDYSARELYLSDYAKSSLREKIRELIIDGLNYDRKYFYQEIYDMLRDKHPEDIPDDKNQRKQLESFIINVENTLAYTTNHGLGY